MITAPHAHGVFHRWLLFFGVVLFAGHLAADQGLLARLVEQDRSRLSLGILALFAIASLRAGVQAWRLARETERTERLRRRAAGGGLFTVREGTLRIEDTEEDCIAREHLMLLARRAQLAGDIAPQPLLIDRLEHRIRSGHESGWFLSDLLIRLGLLGTVIGFIFMLGALVSVESVDLQALQRLLGDMTGGMRVALYTTLTGLGAGMLLSFQHQLLDQGADRLLADLIELGETALPELRRLAERPEGA